MRRLGIIGGVGPLASAKMYLKIVSEVVERTGGSYPDIIQHSIPLPAGVHEFFIHGRVSDGVEREMISLLEQSVKGLQRSEAQCIVIACNTLHPYVEAIAERQGIPLLNMVTATLGAARAEGFKRLAVLCSESTKSRRVYDRCAAAHGLELIYPTRQEQETLNGCILYSALATSADDYRASFSRLAEALAPRADCLLLACTDLNLLAEGQPLPLPIVDSLAALAAASVEYICGSL